MSEQSIEIEIDGIKYTAKYNYEDAIHLNTLFCDEISLQSLTDTSLAENLIKETIINHHNGTEH